MQVRVEDEELILSRSITLKTRLQQFHAMGPSPVSKPPIVDLAGALTSHFAGSYATV